MKRGGHVAQVFALLVSVGFLAGCASPQMSRIDRNRALYESWDLDTKQAVLDGRVETGMTPDMVEMAWGKPSEVVTHPHQEIWVYRKAVDDGVPLGGPVMSGSMGGSSLGGMSVAAGRGGSSVGMAGSGMGGTLPPPAPAPMLTVEKEVVFRDGVVYRADRP